MVLGSTHVVSSVAEDPCVRRAQVAGQNTQSIKPQSFISICEYDCGHSDFKHENLRWLSSYDPDMKLGLLLAIA
eukprot:m.44486 g.44486  ORF g.44486 m.44486 type:complete len:74 (-) comp10100_c0_seq2:109-330(-)